MCAFEYARAFAFAGLRSTRGAGCSARPRRRARARLRGARATRAPPAPAPAAVGWPPHFRRLFGEEALILVTGARHRMLRALMAPAFTAEGIAAFV